MLDVNDILQPFFSILWFFLGTALFIAVVILLWQIIFNRRRDINDMSVYEKRKYLFDTAGEYELFKLLQANFGTDYYIFPQVHYSHIVQARHSLPYRARLAYWNKINRKSADFVLCDKQQVVPKLIVELDGESHQFRPRQERDAFIDELMKVTNLSILHIEDRRCRPEDVIRDVRVKLDDLKGTRPEGEST